MNTEILEYFSVVTSMHFHFVIVFHILDLFFFHFFFLTSLFLSFFLLPSFLSPSFPTPHPPTSFLLLLVFEKLLVPKYRIFTS